MLTQYCLNKMFTSIRSTTLSNFFLSYPSISCIFSWTLFGWSVSFFNIQFSSVQSLSRVRHFATPWIAGRLSNFIFTFHFHALEKEMATHSSVLAWRIPGTGEPCVLPSMGSHRVGHDWSDLAAAAAGLPVHHHLPEFTQTHVLRVGDAIQPSHPLSSPSPPAPNPSQHQSLFQWVNSSHEVAKALEFQL